MSGAVLYLMFIGIFFARNDLAKSFWPIFNLLAILGVMYRITESRWLVALVVSFWPSRLFLSDLASAWYSPVLMPRINFGLIISMSARCGCIRWLLTHHPDHDINRAE